MSGLRVSRVGFSGDAASATLRSPKQALGFEICFAPVMIDALAYSTAVQRQNLQPCACELPQPCSMTRDAAESAGGVRGPADRKRESSKDTSWAFRAKRFGPWLAPGPLESNQKALSVRPLGPLQLANNCTYVRLTAPLSTCRAAVTSYQRARSNEGSASICLNYPFRQRAHANRRAKHARRYARHRATRTAGTDRPRRFAIA